MTELEDRITRLEEDSAASLEAMTAIQDQLDIIAEKLSFAPAESPAHERTAFEHVQVLSERLKLCEKRIASLEDDS